MSKEEDIIVVEENESSIEDLKEDELGKRTFSDSSLLPAKKQRLEEVDVEASEVVPEVIEEEEETKGDVSDVECCQYCRSIRLDPASKEIFGELVCQSCKVLLSFRLYACCSCMCRIYSL